MTKRALRSTITKMRLAEHHTFTPPKHYCALLELSSILSIHMKRLGEVLRTGAEDQVDESRNKLETTKDLYDGLMSELIVTSFDPSAAYETATQLFGASRVKFGAVDGSQDQQLLAGLAVFWGGSYAATGTIEFRKNDPQAVEYSTGFIERGRGLSSCIPIYVDRIHEVDQMILRSAEPGKMTVTNAMTEQAVVDNSTIANWVMTFSEFYLAYKLIIEEDIRILFLDRSLSATHTALIYDTSRRSHWETDGVIHGFEVDGVPLDLNEIGYGRYHAINQELHIPAARGDYIRYSILYLLSNRAKTMKAEQICEELADNEDQRKRILKYLNKSVSEGYLTENHGEYSINPRYTNIWDRIKKLVITLGDNLFECKSSNPMRIKRNDRHHWLTTQDLAFLSLYCFNMIIEECWRRKVLLLGITKDTTGRDFQNHLIPVGIGAGLWKIDKERWTDIPSTDRMFLQAISLFNHEKIPIPWSLIEYDSAFRTIVPDIQDREGYVSGAIRNRIMPERLFVKTYIQLDQAKSDPQLRSNVLLIDRLVHPEFDGAQTVSFKQDFGGAIETIEPILYLGKTTHNKLQNLIMIVLRAMGAHSIPEVFGHNKPLFIADKIAKGQRMRVKGLIEATGHMLMNNPRLRRFTFYMHTFRERRSEVEYTRR